MYVIIFHQSSFEKQRDSHFFFFYIHMYTSPFAFVLYHFLFFKRDKFNDFYNCKIYFLFICFVCLFVCLLLFTVGLPTVTQIANRSLLVIKWQIMSFFMNLSMCLWITCPRMMSDSLDTDLQEIHRFNNHYKNIQIYIYIYIYNINTCW